MPKKAKLALEISKTKTNSGTKYEATRWLLWSRSSLWHGDRVQSYFVTKGEAEAERSKLLEQQAEHGRLADQLNSSQRVDARRALDILSGRATLTGAAEYWVKMKAARKGAFTFRQLIPEYLKELGRRGVSAKYMAAQEGALNVLARARSLHDGQNGVVAENPESPMWGDRHITEITPEEIEAWLHAPVHGHVQSKEKKAWKPQNLRNYTRDLSMFFGFVTRKKKLLDSNPVSLVARPRVGRHAPQIYGPDEVLKILEHAPANGLYPMYVICFFSGLRIEEALRARWEWFDFVEKEIRLPGRIRQGDEVIQITKTGQPRNVRMHPVLLAWLKPRGVEGPIVKSTNLRNRRDDLVVAAEVEKKRNALRHTYASHHAACYRDPGALQMQLGQDTPTVLFKHYIAAVSRKQAERFFALRPVNGKKRK